MHGAGARGRCQSHMGFLMRLRGCVVLLLMAGLAAAGTDDSPPAAAHTEEEIESAMLYNFAKFVEWPAGALGAAGAPVVIGVLGADSFIPKLDALLHGKTIQGHPIVVHRLDGGDPVKNCAVLFIGPAGRHEMARILQSASGPHILTIGDSAAFVRLGGVIAFLREDHRIRFEVNLDAAQRAGLEVSSKMLRLATVYREGPVRAGN